VVDDASQKGSGAGACISERVRSLHLRKGPEPELASQKGSGAGAAKLTTISGSAALVGITSFYSNRTDICIKLLPLQLFEPTYETIPWSQL